MSLSPGRIVMASVILAMWSEGTMAAEQAGDWKALSEAREIRYRSAGDKTEQPAMFYAPPLAKSPAPLLVGLHSWRGDYLQDGGIPYAKWCAERGWIFIHPDFRGANSRPEATGSELVVADILSAVEYAKSHANVDPSRIYLVGVSGGGYTALLMAGRAPGVWAGVSAWAPITDLRDWFDENTKLKRDYADNIAASCGGDPFKDPKAGAEAARRSPLTHLAQARGVPLDINAGIRDKRVYPSHSLKAFNLLAAKKDLIGNGDIRAIVDKGAVPAGLQRNVNDPAYGAKRVLFRRSSGNARITVFQGGHEIIVEAALEWLSRQKKTATPMREKEGKD